MAELIHKRGWDSKTFDTGKKEKGKPVFGAMLQNGLHDIEPDGSFVECDMTVEEATDGVTHLKVKRGRYGELRFGDSGHPNSFLVKIKNKGLKGISFKYTGAVGSFMTNNNGKPLCGFDNGISIESTPTYKGVKMDIIVEDPLTAPLEYPFSIKTYGQNYVFVEENGGATLRGEDQGPIFIKPPFAVDANGDIGSVSILYTGMDGNLITFKKVVDEVWLRNAAAPVRIDPDVTIEDGVDGGVIEDNYFRSNLPNNNYGHNISCNLGFNDERKLLAGVILTDYAGISVISAKFSYYSSSAAILSDVSWYRVKRIWGEGVGNGDIALTGESSWNDYSVPNGWEIAGCGGANDREQTAQNPSPVILSGIGWHDFDCLPDSVELDVGGFFSILIQDPVAGAINKGFYSSQTGQAEKPTFFMEFIEGAGEFQFFFNPQTDD